MDQLLAKAGSQAVTFAIRSGISIASGFAIKRVSKFLDKIPDQERKSITLTREKIRTKIEILTMSIDLLKLANARGNSVLETTVNLIDSLEEEFDSFDEKVANITDNLTETNEIESVRKVEAYMKQLLEKIDEAVPLLHLSLSVCGISLNGNLPEQISPGRLLQASNYVVKSNESKKSKNVLVGHKFDLVFYSVFYNPSRLRFVESDNTSGLSLISWKEEFARSLVSIHKTSHKDEYDYNLEIEENFDDGRYHEEGTKPQRRTYNILTINRLFFSHSGKLLRLDSRSSPVLILKVVHEDFQEVWIAFGELNRGEFDNSDGSDSESSVDNSSTEHNVDGKDTSNKDAGITHTSLSLLEYLIRLCVLQKNEKKSILSVPDEKISLYLRDENSSTSSSSLMLPDSRKQRTKNEQKTQDALTYLSNISRLDNLKIDN